jgi:hypothetical protein
MRKIKQYNGCFHKENRMAKARLPDPRFEWTEPCFGVAAIALSNPSNNVVNALSCNVVAVKII